MSSSQNLSSPSQNTLILYPALKTNIQHAEARMDEACGLAQAIALNIVHKEIITLRTPRAPTLIGEGHVKNIHDLVTLHDVKLVYIDAALTPIQQRNLEKAWNAKVIDRTGLILEIFGARARTAEGRLQVELAALSYQRSRLVRSWTHLERQRGSLGFIGGPGETQLEVDKRLISERITKIKHQLEQVVRTRSLHRAARRRVPYPIVALVGYTNAGKSTLFNQLTHAQVFAEDLLFATLDPTMRKLKLPSGREIILSDTVGFISDLPTQLIAAFRATLEEVLDADLILHVRDISHPNTDQQASEVYKVLEELGLKTVIDHGMVEVLNKIDLMQSNDYENLSITVDDNRILVSALTQQGLDTLLSNVDERLTADYVTDDLTLNIQNGAALAWLYDHGHVLSQKISDDEKYIYVSVRYPLQHQQKFKHLYDNN